jgi:hypothetical protein
VQETKKTEGRIKKLLKTYLQKLSRDIKKPIFLKAR